MSEENGARVLRKAMSESAGGNHHVHFPESDAFPANDEIIVQSTGKDAFTIHVGFLQHLHRYSLAFLLPAKDVSADLEVSDQGVPNLNCKLVKAEKVEQGLNLTMEFFAHKDKLLKEKISLQDKAENGKLMHLEFHARVLGHGKGTPMLKDGVHCLSVEKNDEDDGSSSDWQGF